MKCEACGHIKETRKKATLPDADFDKFWKVYPKKTGKFLANKVWKAICGDQALVQIIINAVDRQRRSTDWTKDNGAYIPHASTWLNQRRWDDEVGVGVKIVHRSESQDPLNVEKQQAAKNRLAAIAQKEWDKRELVRLAQERDDARSRKMAEATGEKEDNLLERFFVEEAIQRAEAAGEKEVRVDWSNETTFSTMPFKVKIPQEIKNCRDENGHKWIEEMERRGSDED